MITHVQYVLVVYLGWMDRLLVFNTIDYCCSIYCWLNNIQWVKNQWSPKYETNREITHQK